MDASSIPVFDANSEFCQNLGLLKVAETATRQHGDHVVIRASDVRDLYLLGGNDSIRYWKSHQGHFQTELGDIASNAAISRLLLGDWLDEPEHREVWMATGNRLAAVAEVWDGWFHDALVAACRSFLADIPAGGQAVDLRGLCRMWSIRAVCPVLFGPALGDEEMADGLLRIEEFYFAMSTRDPSQTASPESMAEFQAARNFLDRVVEAALTVSTPGDDTVVAWIAEAVPAGLSIAEQVACLRPTLGRMLLEKLNIDGLGLLWTLVHLAQDPTLADEVAAELDGRDIFGLPDQASPLAWSVVQEGQRLYPELPFIYRITSQAVTLGPVTVPARATVLFAPWLVHRDPRYWAAPQQFCGRRFLDRSIDTGHYLPFGVGPRIRARARFILHQLTIAVRAICTTHRMALAPNCRPGNLRPVLRSTLAPRGPVPVIFTPRA
ncbi:cytochrome P450 [Azospirillum sp. HJ39]|uniref:cytochrome P450 n=1 Tax=Azospirillum sp. HJ39 TaxID=3159496 RepID=UPI003556E573